jgi:polysaccharide pyruvyl transferase WcaK-like protein
MKRILTDFAIGFIAGFVIAAVIFGIVAGAVNYRNKYREKMQYVELQQEIEALREDIINLTTDELLELPDIRRAAENAASEFERKRDEALQRFRSGLID